MKLDLDLVHLFLSFIKEIPSKPDCKELIECAESFLKNSPTKVKENIKQLINNLERNTHSEMGRYSQVLLGFCYQHGLGGLKKSVIMAKKCYERPDVFKLAIAKRRLGTIYHIGDEIPRHLEKAATLYEEAYQMGDYDACFNLGLLAKLNCIMKIVKSELDYYHIAAEKGCILAQYKLGLLYEKGEIVKKDLEKSREYYLMAACQNCTVSLSKISSSILPIVYPKFKPFLLDFRKMMEDKKNNEELLAILESFIKGNLREVCAAVQKLITLSQSKEEIGQHALILLGYCYECGIGIPLSYEKATEIYQSPHLIKFPAAKCRLACCYWHGRGVQKNLDKALELIKEAQTEGLMNATLYLGMILKEQDKSEIPSNHEIISCFMQSASLGSVGANFEMGLHYENGVIVKKDLPLAFKYYSKAASLGHPEAIRYVGEFFKSGMGVAKDEKRAFEQFKIATEANSVHACHELAICYLEGCGTAVDLEKALELFERAALFKNMFESHYYLAQFYELGILVTKDEKEALSHYLYCLNNFQELSDTKQKLLKYKAGKFFSTLNYKFHNDDLPLKNEALRYYEDMAKAEFSTLKQFSNYFEKGIEVLKDESAALTLFEQSAFLQNKDSIKELICWHYNKSIKEKDQSAFRQALYYCESLDIDEEPFVKSIKDKTAKLPLVII